MELSPDKIINPQNHKLNKWLLFLKNKIKEINDKLHSTVAGM